jgi:BirA family transcriptional regulator, biotin operon repressor / biotin---[acetyl-CoA-carboxylase] ligase
MGLGRARGRSLGHGYSADVQVRWLAETPSTQDVARDLPVGSCVVTDHQTRGRGRRDRRWETPPGTALLASFVLPSRHLVTLAVGVAAAHACGPGVRLKWPNDLLVDGAKLGGILTEQRGAACVVGVGINLTWAPPGAAALGADRDELLARLSDQLERWSAAADKDVLAGWRARSDTLGRRVRVELTHEVVEGVADGIAEDGALLVSGRRVVAGDVVHLRPCSTGPT